MLHEITSIDPHHLTYLSAFDLAYFAIINLCAICLAFFLALYFAYILISFPAPRRWLTFYLEISWTYILTFNLKFIRQFIGDLSGVFSGFLYDISPATLFLALL